MPVILSPPETPQRDYPILPAPSVGISKEFKKTSDGRILGTEYVFTFQGTLIPKKGNPYQDSSSSTTSVTFENTDTGPSWVTTYDTPNDDPVATSLTHDQLLEVLLEKQRLLEEKLSYSDLTVKILSLDGTPIRTIYCDGPTDITFDTDRLAVRSDYTFTIRAPFLNEQPESFNWLIESAQENYSVNERNEALVVFDGSGNISTTRKIFEVSHNISAVGQRGITSSGLMKAMDAWQHASGWIHDSLNVATQYPVELNSQGIDNDFMIPTGDWVKYNHVVVEDSDRLGGSYSINETYVYTSGDPVVEQIDFSVNRDLTRLVNVQVQGTIEGLNTYSAIGASGNIDKYSNAEDYFNNIQGDIRNRAMRAAGLNYLHVVPVSSSIGKNPSAGQISYNYTFDTRPPALVSGSLSETIEINDTFPGQIFSVTPVIGRNQPILQYLNSRSQYERSLNINIVMSGNTVWESGNPTRTQLTAALISQKPSLTNTAELELIHDAVNPINDGAVSGKVFYGPAEERWNPYTGEYSYQKSWTYER